MPLCISVLCRSQTNSKEMSFIHRCLFSPLSFALIVASFAGKMLSVLDGVPLAVKDDIDCVPHPSTGAESLRKLLLKF